MSEKVCYYEVLGVAREATCGDIRKAYKKLALKYHPDRNNGCDKATHKFKEVTEAYQVLSDDDKRSRYDQFGHDGVEGAAGFDGDIFSHFQDLFSDFFGGFGGGFAGQRQRGPARGRDVRVTQPLSLEEAVLGVKKELELTTPVSCTTCEGSGAHPGSEPKTCGTCSGRGQISSGRGFIMFTQNCPACQGAGSVVDDPCEACDGVGWEEKSRTVTVSFPAGIDQGHRLRVVGQGLPGTRGGPAGNLYVDVVLEPHERFERQGDDLVARSTVSFVDATLGTTLELELLDGSRLEMELPSGAQPGDVLHAPGKGAPHVNGRGCGDLHVLVQVAVPKRVSRRAKRLLRDLERELSGEAESREAAKAKIA
jgi:molecular chaperone DnaJ